jgi:hypothetical protein
MEEPAPAEQGPVLAPSWHFPSGPFGPFVCLMAPEIDDCATIVLDSVGDVRAAQRLVGG